MATFAERKGDTYLINGSKNWITNGPKADAIVLFAMTQRGVGHRGATAFIVPLDAKGVVRNPHDDKLGIRAAHSCTIFFENVTVPVGNRLSEEGSGFKVAMATLDGGRIGIAAQALGIARAAYEKALAYAKERHSFGVPISQHQAIQFKLADMAMEIDAARLLIWRAATMKNRGVRHTSESSIAKLYASEMATRVTHQALQIFGGYGYSTEFDVERHYRDARITEIYEGTSEIQRIVIASNALKG
jgi:butyryl-CoA dehydrogenase